MCIQKDKYMHAAMANEQHVASTSFNTFIIYTSIIIQ